MIAVLASALLMTIALLGTALFALLGQLNSFRSEVRAEFADVRRDFGDLRSECGDLRGEFGGMRAGLARVEHKLAGELARR